MTFFREDFYKTQSNISFQKGVTTSKSLSSLSKAYQKDNRPVSASSNFLKKIFEKVT